MSEIKILAIETASEACSASLLSSSTDNKQTIHSQVELMPRQHAKKILSMLDAVLNEADIELSDVDAIAYGQGPGAFTGLRISAGIAQGVSLAGDKKVIAISTLEALALQAIEELEGGGTKYEGEIIATALDARMGEVYWCLFKFVDEQFDFLCDEQVTAPKQMLDALIDVCKSNNGRVLAAGAGWDEYFDELQSKINCCEIHHLKQCAPMSSSIAKLALPLFIKGKTLSPEQAQPVYIRNDVAKKSQKQKV